MHGCSGIRHSTRSSMLISLLSSVTRKACPQCVQCTGPLETNKCRSGAPGNPRMRLANISRCCVRVLRQGPLVRALAGCNPWYAGTIPLNGGEMGAVKKWQQMAGRNNAKLPAAGAKTEHYLCFVVCSEDAAHLQWSERNSGFIFAYKDALHCWNQSRCAQNEAGGPAPRRDQRGMLC